MMAKFRLLFLGAPTDCGAVILHEREISAADATVAAKEAAKTPWPPGAFACRILELDGRVVDWRSRGESGDSC